MICLYIYILVWKEGIWYFSYILQGELALLYTRQTQILTLQCYNVTRSNKYSNFLIIDELHWIWFLLSLIYNILNNVREYNI